MPVYTGVTVGVADNVLAAVAPAAESAKGTHKMRSTCLQENLSKALNTLGRAVATRLGIEPTPLRFESRDGVWVAMEAKVLRDAIDKIVFAAATEDSRPVLTGVKLEIEGDSVTFAAADGFRLAVQTAKLASPVAQPVDCIIPARTLSELQRLLSDQEDPVEFMVTPQKSQILFKLKNAELVSQPVQGKFPNYNRLIPETYSTRSVMSLSDFSRAIRTASIFARDGSGIVRVQALPGAEGSPGKVIISARAEELGDITGVIDAAVDGEEAKIAFSSKYLTDVLGVLGSEQVALETTTPSSPGVIKPVSGNGSSGERHYVHVVMPMFVQW